MKLALEALKQIDEAMPFPVAKLAQAALREAQAKQPAQRTWVGLSDLDMDELENEYMKSAQTAHEFLRAIEVALRSKNT